MPAAAITIDDFSVGAITIDGPNGVGAQVDLDPAHVIGGRRDIFVERTGDRAQVETGKGRFHFSIDPSDHGYYQLTYGQSAPLGADFTAQGHDRIRFRFVDVESPGVFWTYVNTTLPPTSNGVGLGSAIRALNGYGVVEVPYSLYGANFSSVSNFAIWEVRVPPGGRYGIEEIATAGPPLPGDYDRDGQVSLHDFEEWRRMYGATAFGGILLGPDGNGDGRVDAADYLVWRKNFEATDGSGGAGKSVPEPCTLPVVVMAIGSLLATRHGCLCFQFLSKRDGT